MELAIDLALLKEYASSPTTQSFTTDVISKIKTTQEIIQENMTESAQRSKKFYDTNAKEPEIEVGAKVLLHSSALKTGNPLNFIKIGSGLILSYQNQMMDCCIDSVIANSLEPWYTLTD